jgi:hypothetical protein
MAQQQATGLRGLLLFTHRAPYAAAIAACAWTKESKNRFARRGCVPVYPENLDQKRAVCRHERPFMAIDVRLAATV